MKLLKLLFRGNRLALTGIFLLSLCSAVLSVAIIAFINWRLIDIQEPLASALSSFLLLLILLLVCAAAGQIALHRMGHGFVYALRRSLVRRVMATEIERLEQIGGARILASLSSDVRNITIAFVYLPELVYGLILSVAAFIYLAWLSPPLFAVTAIWLSLTLLVGWYFVGRVNHHIRLLREAEDRLYRDYQAIIDGRKELALNRERARLLFAEEFDCDAQAYRDAVTSADIHNGLAGNWANCMVLGTIGLVFFCSSGLGWAEAGVAATFALCVLFLRAPLVSTVAALPGLLAARISLEKLESLGLAQEVAGGGESPALGGWRELRLAAVEYRYPEAGGEGGFDLGPLDFTLRKGELVFVVGGNGSGKSTFARLLTGLQRPLAGAIELDGRALTADQLPAYRQLFAAVFSDFHLFSRLLGPAGADVDASLVDYWLERLRLQHKLGFAQGRLSDTRFSQGQRKRLALMLAILEGRDILLLDEWAADQDPLFRKVFYRELLPQLKAAGKTVIAITHDDHYFDQADRLLKMDGGRLFELTGPARERASRDALLEIGGSAKTAPVGEPV